MARLTLNSLGAIIFSLFIFSPALAAIEVYDFSKDELRHRYKELGGQLRCPKCENQSIIDSNSESAYDLRQELYRLLEEGASDTAIFSFMRERFGDYVLYNPSKDQRTWLLWYLPPALLLLALIVALVLVKKQQTAKAQKPSETQAERQLRLDKILQLEAQQNTPTSKENS